MHCFLEGTAAGAQGNHGYAMGPRFGGGHSMMDSAMQRSTQPLHSFKLRSKATKSSRE
jgi:hypothetical protein